MTRAARGFSLIGMLISLACIAVLFALSMNALNKTMTGQGNTVSGTVRSLEDQMNLQALYQVMIASARDYDRDMLTPSWFTGSLEDNTSAAFWSAMVMQNQVGPKQLVAANEYNFEVNADDDYDYTAHNPSAGLYWDPAFSADLDDGSNVSWAHMPLFGARYDRGWNDEMSHFPLIGHRGPKDGVHDPDSWSYGRSGVWAGYAVYGDGAIDYHSSFDASRLTIKFEDGPGPDNLFFMEEGPDGNDAILGFTKSMTDRGPELQWD